MKDKNGKTIKEAVMEILEDFQMGYTPNSGRSGMRHWRDQITNLFRKKIKELEEDFNKRN